MAFRVTITIRIVSMVKAFHREVRRRQPSWPGPSRGHHGSGRYGLPSPPRETPPRIHPEDARRPHRRCALEFTAVPIGRLLPVSPAPRFARDSSGMDAVVLLLFPP